MGRPMSRAKSGQVTSEQDLNSTGSIVNKLIVVVTNIIGLC